MLGRTIIPVTLRWSRSSSWTIFLKSQLCASRNEKERECQWELWIPNLPGHFSVVKIGYNILVGGIPTPLKNMSSSVGMMTFPIYGKSKKNQGSKPPIQLWSSYGHYYGYILFTTNQIYVEFLTWGSEIPMANCPFQWLTVHCNGELSTAPETFAELSRIIQGNSNDNLARKQLINANNNYLNWMIQTLTYKNNI